MLEDDLALGAQRRERLLVAAAEAATFTHPSVAPLLEIGEGDGEDHLFVVYDAVAGTTLRATLAQRRFSLARGLAFATALAEVLADIHEADLVHGGLGPDAVLVTSSGDPAILYLGMGAYATDAATDGGAYTAPEVFHGQTLDERADVFSLGALLVQLLTGHPPKARLTPAQIAQQLDARLPADLRHIVTTTLATDRDARCGSAAAVAAELQVVSAILSARGHR
jgi:serine/threonine-protein kinase